MMIRTIAAAGLVFLAAANLPAEASTVSATWAGHISDLFYVDNSTGFGYDVGNIAGVQLNDPFEVSYSYETTAKIYTGIPGSSPITYYATGFSLTLGTFHVAFSKPRVSLFDYPDSSTYLDNFQVWGCPCFEPVTSNIPGWTVDGMYLSQWLWPTTLQSTDLPTSPLDPANDLSGDEFQLTLEDPGTGNDYYIIGSLKPPAPTPIPASAALFLTALGGLGFASWTRRRA